MSEKLSKKMGKRTAQIGAFVIAAAFLAYGLHNLFVSVVAFSAAGFFNAALYPLQSQQLNGLIPSEQRATLISINSMFFSIVMILLFPLVGVLADWYGLTAVLMGVSVLLIAFGYNSHPNVI